MSANSETQGLSVFGKWRSLATSQNRSQYMCGSSGIALPSGNLSMLVGFDKRAWRQSLLLGASWFHGNQGCGGNGPHARFHGVLLIDPNVYHPAFPKTIELKSCGVSGSTVP